MYNPDIHKRKSIRLKGYDYSKAGYYYVTICCQNKICRFGNIENGIMYLNEFGEIAFDEWIKLPERFHNIVLDIFQIMPNHMHAILIIEDIVGATLAVAPGNKTGNDVDKGNQTGNVIAPGNQTGNVIAHGNQTGNDVDKGNQTGNNIANGNQTGNVITPGNKTGNVIAHGNKTGNVIAHGNKTGNVIDKGNQTGIPFGKGKHNQFNRAGVNPARTIDNNKIIYLGDVIGAYKSLVFNKCLDIYKFRNEVMGKLWHRNYWEHIIRNEKSYSRIAEYIRENPLNWSSDKLHPDSDTISDLNIESNFDLNTDLISELKDLKDYSKYSNYSNSSDIK